MEVNENYSSHETSAQGLQQWSDNLHRAVRKNDAESIRDCIGTLTDTVTAADLKTIEKNCIKAITNESTSLEVRKALLKMAEEICIKVVKNENTPPEVLKGMTKVLEHLVRKAGGDSDVIPAFVFDPASGLTNEQVLQLAAACADNGVTIVREEDIHPEAFCGEVLDMIDRNQLSFRPASQDLLVQGEAASIKKTGNDKVHDYFQMMSALARAKKQLKEDLSLGNGPALDLSDQASRESYARRSLVDWARRTFEVMKQHPDPRKAKKYTENVAFQIYNHWRGDSLDAGVDVINKREKCAKAFHKEAKSLSERSVKSTTVKVYPQGVELDKSAAAGKTNKDKKFLTIRDAERALGKEKARNNIFAVRIVPAEKRKKASGNTSRISLFFEPHDAISMMNNLRKIVKEEKTSVHSAKIMSAKEQLALRVDNAVIYLGMNNLSIEEGELIAKKVLDSISRPNVSHCVPGMYPLSENASYAEYAKGLSTSHGKNRSGLISEVVNKMLVDGAGVDEIESYLARYCEIYDYDPIRPELLARE